MKFNRLVTVLAALLVVMTALPQAVRCQSSSSEESGPSPGPVNFNTPPVDRKNAIEQLTAMIDGDYEYWTGGKEYLLTLREIGWLQRDPKLTNAQAALMGALALTIEGASGKVRRISYEKLVELAKGKQVEVRRFRGDGATTELSYLVDEYMTEYKNLLTNKNAKGFDLWGRKGQVTVDGLKQSQVGDCFWMAAIGAVVLKRPQMIQEMIHQTAWDKYEVSFPGHEEPIRITLTDGEIAQFSIGNYDGCWMPILGLGDARILDKRKGEKNFWKITPLGALDAGSTTIGAMRLLTGHNYKYVYLNNVSENKVAMFLRRATRESVPVCFSTSGHSLSVADYNDDTRTIRLHNPWGTTGQYRVWNNDEYVATLPMTNGFFEVPLSKACRIFSTIDVPVDLEQ